MTRNGRLTRRSGRGTCAPGQATDALASDDAITPRSSSSCETAASKVVRRVRPRPAVRPADPRLTVSPVLKPCASSGALWLLGLGLRYNLISASSVVARVTSRGAAPQTPESARASGRACRPKRTNDDLVPPVGEDLNPVVAVDDPRRPLGTTRRGKVQRPPRPACSSADHRSMNLLIAFRPGTTYARGAPIHLM